MINAKILIDAVGMLDDSVIESALTLKRTTRHVLRPVLSVAAAVMLLLCSLPAATALGVERAYEYLYLFSPVLAQSFKPVNKTSTDNGIELCVISADITGDTAKFYVSLRDLEGGRLDGTTDLFDSYGINCPFDSECTCSRVRYDESEQTVYYVCTVSRADGKPIKKGKLTFSLSSVLTHKKDTSGVLFSLDNVDTDPATRGLPSKYNGASYDTANEPDLTKKRFLAVPDAPYYVPCDGVSIEAVGYIDGELHILTRYKAPLTYDNHGFVSLCDSSGNVIETEDTVAVSFSGSDGDSYTETIIPAEYGSLKGLSLYGEFTTCSENISGRWRVTFRLSDD